MMSESDELAAGWKPDPGDANQQRYWDGAEWTEHVAPANPGTLPAGQAPVQLVVEEKSVGLAIFLNFIWAGVGQLYAGVNKNLGIMFMAIEAVNWVLTVLFGFFLIIGFCFGFVVWLGLFIWSSIDVNNAIKNQPVVHIGN